MTSSRSRFVGWLAFVAASCVVSAAVADERQLANEKFFESHVRPLLVAKCLKCHGDQKQRGGLRLDSREAALEGGESGASLVPGDLKKSLLIEAINYESLEMPPDKKLSDDEIAVLTRWVTDGAVWPDSGAKSGKAKPGRHGISDEDRKWWAFQPIQLPPLPVVTNEKWARNEIDRFVLSKLEQAQLAPAAEADRGTLIRRLSFDLIGLPPTPEEIAAFVSDDQPQAYERLVDRLLASERYGERWARHWFDLTRYNESDGYRQDAYRPDMWRYRDYVIQSFNADKPFNQFVSEQLAGDELDPDNPDARIATGYWRLYLYEYNQRDARTHWQSILDELTDVTGEVFLGLGIGCAKCHDHKFDPILRDDYFRLQAHFSSIVPRDKEPVVRPDQLATYQAQLTKWETATQSIHDEIDRIRQPYVKKALAGAFQKFPPDVRAVADIPFAERSALDHQMMDLMERQIYLETEKPKLKEEDSKRVEELQKELAKFDDIKPAPLPVSLTVTDAGAVPAKTVVPGDRKARDILPGLLTILNPQPTNVTSIEAAPNSTGRRAALARSLTSADNPLTPRVIVNRVWQAHFGAGIVPTASDFGHLGELPTHPELLDWLARYFVDHGGNFKSLHRLMVLSATYRQSASNPQSEAATLLDPLNQLRWRWDVRRLDAEQIRDAMLLTAGELDLTAGGPSVEANKPRRSIYTKQMRNSLDPFLAAFDVADGFNSTAKRNVTTTPTQSLLMVNGSWPLGRSKPFAGRIDKLVAQREPGTDPHVAAAKAAWRLAFGREPDESELASATHFLRDSGNSTKTVAPLTSDFAATQSMAADISPSNPGTQWKLATKTPLFEGDFTLEAVVQLRSIYPDANVRTIASQWDGDQTHPGWNLGVTSTKSKHEPRNLILQLVGTAAGNDVPIYEVLPSNLKLELNRPYYVAVCVRLGETSDKGVTFFVQDLSKPGSEMQTASVAHRVTGGLKLDKAFVLGDRDGKQRSRWDGLLDDVRLSSAALLPSELRAKSGVLPSVVGDWNFNDSSSPGQTMSGAERQLAVTTEESGGLVKSALADLCHVLLNSNEFLYLD